MDEPAVVLVTVKVTTPEALDAPDATEIASLAPRLEVSVTVFPETGLELPSFKVTVIVDIAVPFAVTDVGEELIVLTVPLTAPTVPVAVNVAGVGMPETLAVTVLVAATVPSVRVLLDRPLEFVELEELEREPPPAVTAQLTVAPETEFPLESLTTAVNAVPKVLPTVAL